jgi:RNA polymerase sigma-70 factor (ECF subfamily)
MSHLDPPHPMALVRSTVPVMAEDREEGSTPAERLRRIVDAHYDFLWRSLRRLGVPEASVEDAAQQVLVVLSRRLGSVAEGSERSFLFGTAMRVAADVRRTMRRHPENATAIEDDALEALAHPGPGPDAALDEQRARVLLQRILDAMPEEQRAVFILFELEEMSTPAIAGMLGVPLGTAASRLRRARDFFAQSVSRHRAREGASHE